MVLDEVSSVLDLRARQSEEVAFAGSQVLLTLLGTFETDAIFPGYVICRGGSVRVFLLLRNCFFLIFFIILLRIIFFLKFLEIPKILRSYSCQ